MGSDVFDLFLPATKSVPDVELLGAHTVQATLPVGRFRFPNGLTLITMLDHRAPVFSYQTWIRIGSKHEHPKRTGLAHLLEHLMFKATHRHEDGLFDRELELRGADSNAATWVDWTYYHETLAARGDNLQRVVELESDRLHNLLLTPDTFGPELEVVLNERRMTIDDSVLGSLNEATYATAFTQHPYGVPTIGHLEHLESTTLEHVREFYDRYYAPDQTVLTVVGDLDPEETLKVIKKAYGHLEPSKVAPPPVEPEPPQSQERRVLIERPVQSPFVSMAYHVPAQLDSRYLDLEAAHEILLSGHNARLYRRLVTLERVASDVDGYLTPFAEPGLFEIVANLRSGVDPNVVIELVQEEIDGLATDLRDDEVEKAKNGIELAHYDSMSHVDGLAEELGHYEVAHGDCRLAFENRRRIRGVSEQSILDATRAFLKRDNRTIGIVHSNTRSL